MLCLVACVGASALWARRAARADVIAFTTPGGHWQAAASSPRGLVLFFSAIPAGREWGSTVRTASLRREVLPELDQIILDQVVFGPGDVNASVAGFKVAAGTFAVGSRRPGYRAILLPHWALVLPLALPPIVWLRNRVRVSVRGRQGRCRQCGYDLRGSPGRCPECGGQRAGRAPVRAVGILLATGTILAAAVMLEAVRQGVGSGAVPGDRPVCDHGVDRILPDFEVDHLRFDEVVEFFSETTGARLRIDAAALADAGITPGTPVTGQFRHVKAADFFAKLSASLPTAVELVCEQDGTFTLTPRHAVLQVRMYDAQHLIGKAPVNPFYDGPDFQLPEERSARDREELVEELTTFLKESVEPDSWRGNGGTLGGVSELDGWLGVVQTPENLRQTEVLLEKVKAWQMADDAIQEHRGP